MPILVVKKNPRSPGSRFQIVLKNSDLEKDKSKICKRLTAIKKRRGGRNNAGRITVRFRGGEHRKRYRIVDFKRDKHNIPARVESMQYDPNRTANLLLLLYADGERRYILAPKNVKVGDTLISAENAPIAPGNTLPLKNIPLGTYIHCIELRPLKGAQMIRSAGTSAQLMAREGNYATIRLKSGEVRKVLVQCRATIGEVGNSEHGLTSLGKAGRKRHLGRRPHVRGVAMNPVDHPHGGGEGKTSGGRHPVSPWGTPTKGYRTRKNKKTNKYIVKKRTDKK